MFQQVILAFAVLGVVINIIAFVIITKKKDKSMFHDLLKILTLYDVGVVICCALQFALPNLWSAYANNIYPHIMPYLLPVMHITVLSSVYSTILISFERYIRICFYCQLRENSILSEDNIKYYKLFVILFPILFYIPKCFEVRSHYVEKDVTIEIDCQKYLSLSELLKNPLLKSMVGQQFKDADLRKIEFLAENCNQILSQEMSYLDYSTIDYNVELNNETSLEMRPESMYRNITTSTKMVLQAEPTDLRRNVYYYQIYYVYLNTIFASILPLLFLLYFNINTAKELFKMSRLESRSIASMASNVNINRLSNTSGVDLHRPRGMGNDVAGGQRTSSAVMATEAATQNEETKSALEMAAKLHNNLHDSNGLHHSNQFHDCGEVGSEMTNQLLTNHRECNCEEEATAAATSSTTNGDPGAAYSLPTITLTEHDTSANEQINEHQKAADPYEVIDDQISHASSEDIIHTEQQQQDESCSPKNGNGSRRSTITFLLKSHNNGHNNCCTSTASSPSKNITTNGSSIQNNGAKVQNTSNVIGNGNIVHHVCQENHNGTKSPLLTSPSEIEANKDEEIVVGPKLAGNGNYNDCRESADICSQWNGMRQGRRRRASSVWSANTTAIKMSITNALGPRSSRRTTSATLLSLNHRIGSPDHANRQSSSETKKELRLARISLCIVWLFLFCHVWKLVPTFYSTFLDDSNMENDEDMALGIRVEWPEWLYMVENISHTLITLNSSLNFLIYIVL